MGDGFRDRCFILFVEFFKFGQFSHAWAAPGGPKIQHINGVGVGVEPLLKLGRFDERDVLSGECCPPKKEAK